MKRTLSLIMALSIFMQILVPSTWLEAKAEGVGAYSFQWEKNSSLNQGLKVDNIKPKEEEALLSWNVKGIRGKYILEYYIEDEKNPDLPAQKVEFTLDRDSGDDSLASSTVKVYDSQGNLLDKEYTYFNFNNPTANQWIASENANSVTVTTGRGSVYPGARIRIGSQMEIRYRWNSDDTIYFQTNFIKRGNITPFSLKHETINPDDVTTINVLAGLDKYTISPIHIDPQSTEIINKDTIEMPGEEHPGSRPGIKLEFMKPKSLDLGTLKFGYDTTKVEDIKATLVLADLTNTAKAQLGIDLKTLDVTGLDMGSNNEPINQSKKIIEENNKYMVYLAEDDTNNGGQVNNNIIKWETLKESLILKQVDLSLSDKKEPLGTFNPLDKGGESDIGRYTYLGYEIKKSSFQDAYIEIMPYKGTANTEFTYGIKFSNDGVNWDDLLEHKYMPSGSEEEIPFTVPVPFSPSYDNQYYKVVVKYSQGTMESQILHYKPKLDLTIPPPTPIIQSVDNIYVVPPKKLGDEPETIGFDITWNAPRNTAQDQMLKTLLSKGDIYYELYLNDSAKTPKETSSLIKIFKVSLDTATDRVIVSPYGGTAGKETTNPETRYNQSNDTFSMERVVLKNIGKSRWEHIIDMPDGYEDTTKYPSLENQEFKVNDELNKSVPGIYYLTMRALYDPHDVGSDVGIKMGVSNESNAKPISISTLEEVIPVPTNINSKHIPDNLDTTNIAEELSWGSIDINRYKAQMLDPLGLKLSPDNKRAYEIYLYTNKSLKEKDFEKITPAAISLNVSNKTAKLSKDNIQDLRDGKALRIDYSDTKNDGINSIKFENLDPNQVYYVNMRVRLDLLNKDNQNEESRFSIFSKQHSFTSYSKPSEPEPGERVPPVPEKLRIIEQPNNTTAILGWDAPNYQKQEDEKIYYELVKVDSRELLKEEESRLLDVEKLVNENEKNDIQAWRTKDPYITTYNKETKSWKEAKPQQQGERLRLEDGSLSPNNIYYYYVRTVLVIESENVYSSWVGIPVTTDPVQRPIMLKVENEKDYSHDPKREIVVSFMAPIPKDGKVPSEYDFDIALQSELDNDYRLDYDVTMLTSKEDEKNIPKGYTHFVYKIKGLKPGKRYDIKVRVIDKLKDMVNGQYPKSLYSDRVSTRTQFDQDEQDKDDKFAEYIKYYEDKTEALKRKPYWILDDKSKTFSVKYRSSYLVPDMRANSVYTFVIDENYKDYEYYIPAKVIQESNLNQISFEIKQGDISYVIRPEILTQELQDIKETLLDINEKRIRDYYVLFSFGQGDIKPSGELTPQVVVYADLFTLKDEDFIIEDDIMISLNELINKEKKYYIEDLEKAIDRGKILDEDLNKIVDKAIKNIVNAHRKDTRRIIQRSKKDIIKINEWNNGMLIIANNLGSAVAQGYYQDRTRQLLATFNIDGGFAVEANKPGLYGFSGEQVIMPVIPGAPGSINIVVKYQLTEFFGANGQINPQNIVTKRQLLGALAKVLGAQKGADYPQYLKQVGIKGVSNINMDKPIKKQEAIYFLMQGYEKTLRKPIQTVYVKNRNSVPNIRQFNQIYQPYILVAVDSKIIVTNQPINPNENIRVSEVLQMLTNILKEQR